MKRRWKGITALGLSALIGCMAPVSTMMAAAEETETAERVQELEVTEPAAEEVQEPEVTEPTTEETQETEVAESTTEEAPEPESVEAAAESAEFIPQATETAALKAQEQSEKAETPVIVIQLQGQNRAQELGGTIEYNTYFGNRDQRLSISVSQGSDSVSLYYYLDTAARVSNESKSKEQLSDLWQPAEQEVSLGQEGA